MKAMKKVTSLILTFMMVFNLSLSMPATSAFAATHTYQIYQILTGTVDPSDSTKLTNIKAGANLKLGTNKNINDVMDALTATDMANKTNQEKLTVILPYVDMTTPYRTSTSTTVNDLEIGYYLVKDADGSLAGENDAYTTYIVKVVTGTLSITPKKAIPTVDKQVQDEAGDKEEGASEDGWGESADHAINEQFKFKLVASLPNDPDLNDYKTYKLVFTDTMSAGVTFDGIESVKAGENNITNYVLSDNAKVGESGITFTLTINDLKKYVKSLPETQVTVIYKAHLNENAVVNTKADVTEQENNQNKVKLDFSNNPNYKGDGANSPTGSTEYDWVFVLTYEVDNTKYDASTSERVKLANVGFRLYQADGVTEIPVYKGNNDAYYPVGTSGKESEEMFSDANGKFNIKGLDAGSYVLKETNVLPGFTAIEPLNIVIAADHKENANTKSVDLTFKKDSNNNDVSQNMNNDIENKKGSTLPSTGGMGTTIFYVVGTILVLAAVVLLITKKRMHAGK